MEHTITEFKEWPRGLETSYHDWIVLGSKTEIMKALGFKPKYTPGADHKCTYQWNCVLDKGRYYFTIYDMSYGRKVKKDEEIEYHIGFNCRYDDIHEFWPNKKEALDMLEALRELGLNVKHSDTWERWHKEGVFEEIERTIRKNLNNGGH